MKLSKRAAKMGLKIDRVWVINVPAAQRDNLGVYELRDARGNLIASDPDRNVVVKIANSRAGKGGNQ